MKAKYVSGVACQRFLMYLQRIPSYQIQKWEKKYDMEESEEEKADLKEICEKRESHIIRISSSAYIWR